ncbi:MAG: replication-relaxation family protein [Nitrososphaerota archaeon]
MSRQRVTGAYVERLAAELPERDLALVETLDRFRVATAAQLRRLHFTSGTEAANARQVWRRLRALQDLGVIAVLERRIGGGRGGSTQAVFALDVAGQKLGAAAGPAGGRRLRRPWTPGNQFLAHAVAVTELYVVLSERARAGGGEVLAFDAEPLCWRRFTGVGGATAWLKPDAFVRFGAGEYEHLSFVEVDRATASVPTVARKLSVYRRYWQTGRDQERFGAFGRVLLLAPNAARRDDLADAVKRQPTDAQPLFRAALYEEAADLLTGRSS